MRLIIGKPLQIVRDGGEKGKIGFDVAGIAERIFREQEQKLALAPGRGGKRLFIKRIGSAFQIQRKIRGEQVEGIAVLLV